MAQSSLKLVIAYRRHFPMHWSLFKKICDAYRTSAPPTRTPPPPPVAPPTGRLLQLHHLLVAELRPVVHQVVRVVGAAVRAQRRLGDSAALDLHRQRLATDVALEERLAHLRNEARRPDHHPPDRDQLVDVCGATQQSLPVKNAAPS